MTFTLVPFHSGDLFVMEAPDIQHSGRIQDDAHAMLGKLEQLQAELRAKDDIIETQRRQNDELSRAVAKMDAAVRHRDTVIAELALSRKHVFEECHLACSNSQVELRQMQDALHKLSRQLHQERREHNVRVKDLRRQIKSARLAGAIDGLDLGLGESAEMLFSSDESEGSPRGNSSDSNSDDSATLVVGSPVTIKNNANHQVDVDYVAW